MLLSWCICVVCGLYSPLSCQCDLLMFLLYFGARCWKPVFSWYQFVQNGCKRYHYSVAVQAKHWPSWMKPYLAKFRCFPKLRYSYFTFGDVLLTELTAMSLNTLMHAVVSWVRGMDSHSWVRRALWTIFRLHRLSGSSWQEKLNYTCNKTLFRCQK